MTSPTGPKVEQENFLEKLIKIMGATGDSNDAIAVMAVRRATELLAKNNHTWEKILRGKVKVVESPFAAAQRPKGMETTARPAPSARQTQPVHSGRTRKANPASFGSSTAFDPFAGGAPSSSAQPFGQAYTATPTPQPTRPTRGHPSGYGFGGRIYTGPDMCPACHGVGEDMNHRQLACPNCVGSGRDPSYYAKQQRSKPTPQTHGNCKRCGGTGTYSWAPGKSGACFNCQGTGIFTGKTAPKSHARGQADLDSL